MAKVTVGEGVGANLKPDDDGVDLADRADHRVMNVIVDDVRGYEKAECGVDAVGPGYRRPRRLEGAGFLEKVIVRVVVGSFETAESAFGMLSGT